MVRFGHKLTSVRSVKSAAAIALLFSMMLFFSYGANTVQAAQLEEPKVFFRWAFGALVGSRQDRQLESVTRDAALKTGDQLKMMVELQKPCFVYLIHHNDQDEFSLLFPYDLKQFETDYRAGRRYYIPKGDAWFELDQNVGKETFYLLSSPERLAKLEALIAQYGSSEPAKQGDVKRQLLDEILLLKKQHRELAAPAERPVTIGGTIRSYEKTEAGGRPDVASIAEEIRSGGVIVRTFTVEHQ